MIKLATWQIRQFSSKIIWKDIGFDDRVRPQIPFKIVKSMKEDSDIKELIEEVTNSFSKPLTSLLNIF
jgi:hypothetical protein